MNSSDDTITCACPCGATSYTAVGEPLFRLICHCTICQRHTNEAFADVAVFRAKDVGAPPEGSVNYETLRPPPNVQRGTCSSCGAPAIEQFRAPLFPKLTMVPVKNVADKEMLPEPWAHIFYDKRVCDADDELPKYQGYWSSQLLFMRQLMKALFRS